MSFSRVQTITSIALSAAAVLAIPAGTAVAKKKAPKYPVVTKVTPMKVGMMRRSLWMMKRSMVPDEAGRRRIGAPRE